MTPLASTSPISIPIPNCMAHRARKPPTVVREEAKMVFNDFPTAKLKAFSFSIPLERPSSKECRRKMA